MTSCTWNGVSGDWNNGSNWTPSGGPPTSSDSAVINGTATDTITIDTADVANSLILDDPNATVDDITPWRFPSGSSALTLSSTFILSAGTFILGSGGLDANGAISGGTIIVAGGTFVCNGGSLNGLTYDGTLDLSENDANIALNGSTVNGTINDTGEQSDLNFNTITTLNNTTINLGNNEGSTSLIGINGAGGGLDSGIERCSQRERIRRVWFRPTNRQRPQPRGYQPDGKRQPSHL